MGKEKVKCGHQVSVLISATTYSVLHEYAHKNYLRDAEVIRSVLAERFGE